MFTTLEVTRQKTGGVTSERVTGKWGALHTATVMDNPAIHLEFGGPFHSGISEFQVSAVVNRNFRK